jgi:hypothetical protein
MGKNIVVKLQKAWEWENVDMQQRQSIFFGEG